MPIIGKNIAQIAQICLQLGGTHSHALAIARAIYRKRVSAYSEISGVPLALLRQMEALHPIGLQPYAHSALSSDGSSKYLHVNALGQSYESVLMPSAKRTTLCISSQAGCKMGCKFCLTGKMGFNGNLTTADILNQMLCLPESPAPNRLVIMGMGEPLDNYSEIEKSLEIINAEWGLAFGRSNITLSTVGLVDQLPRLLASRTCNVAVSLHSPFREQRMELMPIERTNPIAQVVQIIKENPLPKPLRISFEYVALAGVNTSSAHAAATAQLLAGIKCHLNVIAWNAHHDAQFSAPSSSELHNFIHHLKANGVLVAVRAPRAADIGAACGQMTGKHLPFSSCD